MLPETNTRKFHYYIPSNGSNPPKFKMSMDDRIQFNDDCESAVSYHDANHVIDDRVIFRKEISAAGIVKHWMKSKALWKSGYCEELTPDAEVIFEEYKLYKADKKLYKARKI
jgi:hypothetical protein